MGDERSIFLEALEKRSPQDRSAYLDEACRGDAGLRARVEELLAAHDLAGSFLQSPPPGVTLTPDDSAGGGAPPPPLVERPGATIGPYRLIEPIGEGGMGVVFMAEQLRPVRRRVALKVVKPGLDTKEVIARFEAERQALAMMDHPNIAKVFDAGSTDTGRPYFVMELVRGVPITQYCDEEKLPPRQRLELFAQVCHAVQHAHTKGVIHRDLKPTNVLVTLNEDKPVPKVIDFGIAKATAGQRLTDRTLYTEFRQLVGTPLYMSPEQAEMSALLDVDTRSDVYSLGVLLYELLTGTTPFDKQRLAKAAYDEVRRIIREEEPPRPSTRISTLGETLASVSAQRHTEPKRLGQIIRGELDWIVMRALEKDRGRRYETAIGLAQDVERYLADQPVEACPPSRTYRLRKFVRRNKAAMTTIATVAVVLLLATCISIWLAVRATRAEQQVVRERDQATAEKRRADEQAGVAKAVTAFLSEDVLGQASTLKQQAMSREAAPDRDLKVRDALDRAAGRIPGRFQHEPLVEAAIRYAIGDAYKDLGEYGKAQQHLMESLRHRRRLLGDDHSDTLDVVAKLGALSLDAGQYDRAEGLLHQALHGQQKVLGELNLNRLATLRILGLLYLRRHQYSKSEQAYEQAVEGYRKLLGPEHSLTVSALLDLATTLRWQGRYLKSHDIVAQALKEARQRLGDEHPAVQAMRQQVDVHLGTTRARDVGEQRAIKELEDRRKTLGEAHPETLASLHQLALYYAERGHYAEAEPLYLQALEGRRRILGDQHGQTLDTLMWLVLLYDDTRELLKAEALLLERAEGCLTEPEARIAEAKQVLPHLIACYRDLGQLEKAGHWERKLREFHERDLAAKTAKIEQADPSDPNLASLIYARGGTHLRLGRFPEALADWSRYHQLNPTDRSVLNMIAGLHLYLRDKPGYRAACSKLLQRFGETSEREVAQRTAWVCLIGPEAVDDPAPVMRLVEQAARSDWGPYELLKGLAEYRSGNFGAAADWLSRASDRYTRRLERGRASVRIRNPYPELQVAANGFLAMAEHRRGRVEEARKVLDLAREQLENDVPSITSGRPKVGALDWQVAHLAIREAEAVLSSPVPATTSGASPSSAPAQPAAPATSQAG